MKSSSETSDRHNTLSLLQWYIESGVDETIADAPLDWFDQSGQRPAPVSSAARNLGDSRTSAAIVQKSQPPSPIDTVDQIAKKAETIAASCQSLEELQEAIKGFDGCNIKKTAANTIFADGNASSKIMVIGDAPGVDDDRHGKAFAGEIGQLLDRMFMAIDLDRETDFYITTLLPWRPPGNRKPTPEEITICLPFIKRHIALFDPGLIIMMGGVSTSTLLQTTHGITRLRGKWLDYEVKNRVVPVRPLYHPSYLLQQPKHKKDTWHDLLEIKSKLKELLL